MMPLFVSWHTPDEFYSWQSDRLVKSLEYFALDRCVQTHERPGTWNDCCFRKAYFILGMLGRFPDRNICWIDADGEIEQYPELLDNITTDLAFVENENGYGIASMVYFKNNEASRLFIAEWRRLNEEFPDNCAADQENFGVLARSWESDGKITVTHLPISYCVEDGITRDPSEPVIMQWIASRIGKHLDDPSFTGVQI
jgi:hypothetical protein